ncbi:hypothetical protein [Aeromicrobium sp.]|uniref:T3SS (YopN, CesT) and YbjN peptide-binding chaperone 1 n=1 Tax=Aeromicrobium sp. TaxID=1871063 RepID=UPI00199ADDC6|nr:hypothetical protein [Aeromicrobium sp.]MBC7631603.1 hypothetical protein [Aeromicrobium sp.]
MNNSNSSELMDHVGRCLNQFLPPGALEQDEDGEWRVSMRRMAVFVRVVQKPEPIIHLLARAATGVGPDALAEINHLNVLSVRGKLFRLDNSDVFVPTTIHPAGFNAEVAERLIDGTGEYAEEYGPMLEAVYKTAVTEAPIG